MSTFLKVALALALTLPLGAYITGTLVASQADMPAERAPVVISATPSEGPSETSRPSPTRTPDDGRKDQDADDRDDDKDDSDDRDDTDDTVRVIRPTPRDVDDRPDDRDHPDDRDDRDHSDDGSHDD